VARGSSVFARGRGSRIFLNPRTGFRGAGTLAQLSEGAKTERGLSLPPPRALDAAPPGALIVDIGVAQRLLDRPERLSRLMLEAKGAQPLASVVGDALRLVEPDEDSDLERLTGSFTSTSPPLGCSPFSSGCLSSTPRWPRLRAAAADDPHAAAVGVSSRALIAAMAFELFALALFAGGAACARYVIARALLPMSPRVSTVSTGRNCRAIDAGRGLGVVRPRMALLGAASAAAGGLIRTFRLPVLSVARPQAWREAHRRYLRRQALVAGSPSRWPSARCFGAAALSAASL